LRRSDADGGASADNRHLLTGSRLPGQVSTWAPHPWALPDAGRDHHFHQWPGPSRDDQQILRHHACAGGWLLTRQRGDGRDLCYTNGQIPLEPAVQLFHVSNQVAQANDTRYVPAATYRQAGYFSPSTTPVRHAPLLLSQHSYVVRNRFSGSTYRCVVPIAAAAPAVTATSTDAIDGTTTPPIHGGQHATRCHRLRRCHRCDDASNGHWGPFPRQSLAARPDHIASVFARIPSTTVCSTTPEVRRQRRGFRSRTPEVRAARRQARLTRGHGDCHYQHRSDNDLMPTPNTSACAESMTMNLATPARCRRQPTGPAQRRAYRLHRHRAARAR